MGVWMLNFSYTLIKAFFDIRQLKKLFSETVDPRLLTTLQLCKENKCILY